jgi:hypothetical protein
MSVKNMLLYALKHANIYNEIVMDIHRFHPYILFTGLAITRLTERKETGRPKEFHCKCGEDLLLDTSVPEVNNILKEAGSRPAFPVIARRN